MRVGDHGTFTSKALGEKDIDSGTRRRYVSAGNL